jgi:NAD(P)-dependent dehydrogenase (short-subunit alcohol dehydrogenase family)
MNLVLAPDPPTTSITASGVRALPVQCDVTGSNSRRALVDAATAEVGQIDLLINNTGIETIIRFEEQDEIDLEHTAPVNFLGATALTRLVVTGMLERGRSHVVNVGSLAEKAGTPYEAAYSTTKHGLIGFTRTLQPSPGNAVFIWWTDSRTSALYIV